MSLLLLLLLFQSNTYASSRVTIYNQEVEVNDTIEQANLIQLGQPFNGSVRDNIDVDYYSYTPDENKDIHFIFIGNNEPWYLVTITDVTDGISVLSMSTRSVFEGDYKFKHGHEYLIKVFSPQANNSIYQISVSGNTDYSPVILDGYKEAEPNDQPEYANIITNINGLFSASISNQDDTDYYTYTATEDRNMEFGFYPGTSANFFIMLVDMTTGQYITQGSIKVPGHYEVTPFKSVKGHEYRVAVAVSNGNDSPQNYFFQFWNK